MKVFMILIVHADFSADPRCKLEVEVHISIVWQNICTSLNRERFHDDPCSLLSQLPEDNYKVQKVWHTGTCSLCASTPVAKILVHVLKVAGALLGPRSHDLIRTPEKHANKVQRVWKQIPKFMNVFCCGLSMLFNSLVFQDPSVMTLKPVIRGQLQSMKGTAYWHMLQDAVFISVANKWFVFRKTNHCFTFAWVGQGFSTDFDTNLEKSLSNNKSHVKISLI